MSKFGERGSSAFGQTRQQGNQIVDRNGVGSAKEMSRLTRSRQGDVLAASLVCAHVLARNFVYTRPMFLLPIGHQENTVRRVPWVSVSILMLCLAMQIYSS